MKLYLECIYDNRASFYDKAYFKFEDKIMELYSYDTLVLTLNTITNKYTLNSDVDDRLLFSNTTLRHIKEFLKQFYKNVDYTKKDIIANNTLEKESREK